MTSSSIRSRSGRDSFSHAMRRKAEHTSGDKMKNETAAIAAVSFELVKKRWNAVLRQSRRGRVKGAKRPLRVQSSSFSNLISLKNWTGSGAKRLFRHAETRLQLPPQSHFLGRHRTIRQAASAEFFRHVKLWNEMYMDKGRGSFQISVL